MSKPRIYLANALKNGNFVFKVANLEVESAGVLTIIIEPTSSKPGSTIQREMALKKELVELEVKAPNTNDHHVVRASLKSGDKTDSVKKVILLA